MRDPRYSKLAKILCGHSTKLKKGQTVLIDCTDIPDDFLVSLIREARACGATPLVEVRHSRIQRELIRECTVEHTKLLNSLELQRMKRVQAYIAVRGSHNANEAADVPAKAREIYMRSLRPVTDYRINKTNWVVLRWPTPSMAQSSGKSTEAFEDFFFDVCTLDYSKLTAAMRPLEKRMKRADKVHIKGPKTDLRFSIKGIGAVLCGGEFNIPDGEVFSCPVKDSVEGEIFYNAPSIYHSKRFENVWLKFSKGKIVDASANDTKAIQEIFDTDSGARYVGEFAIGVNPYIMEPMGDILFDEKICGSFHFTPGQAYELCDNGNRSAVHWDLVSIQRKEWGGGEIWFDGECIRRNGLFLPKDLQPLNPQNLLRK